MLYNFPITEIADEIERRIVDNIGGVEAVNDEEEITIYHHGDKVSTIDLRNADVSGPESKAASVKTAGRSARKKADRIAEDVCREYGYPEEV